jgi:hypothetical protein
MSQAKKNNWSALFDKDQAKKPSLDDQKNDKKIVEEKLNELRSKLKDPEFAKKVATLLGDWK